MPERDRAVAVHAHFASLEAARDALAALHHEVEVPASVTVVSPIPLPEGALPVSPQGSPLPRAAAIAGTLGIATGVGLTAGSADLYPIFTGSMPLFPVPPYAIVSYELMMLFAMSTTALGCALLVVRRGGSDLLWKHVTVAGGVGLSVSCRDAAESARIAARLEELGGGLVADEPPAAAPRLTGRLVWRSLLVASLAAAIAAIVLPAVAGYLGWPWNLMRRQVAIRPQELPPVPAPEGIVPFPGAELETAAHARAGLPGGADLPAGARGRDLYRSQCAFCHGVDGRGGGPVASRMSAAPADLSSWGVQRRRPQDLERFLAEAPGPMPPFAHRLRLEERQAVVEYLRTAFRPDPPPPWRRIASADPVERGRVLYEALQCGRCHDEGSRREAAGIPPDLTYAGSKYRREWLRAYLEDPYPRRWKDQDIRPELWMPVFDLGREELDDLVAYLASRTDPERLPTAIRSPGAGPRGVREGRRLFGEYQCLGCHEVSGEGTRIGPELTHVGARLLPSYLRLFIQRPQEIIPGTSMKDFGLWEEEASALTGYLETLE